MQNTLLKVSKIQNTN